VLLNGEEVTEFKGLPSTGIYTVAPTGSRVICVPPPTDTDEDWVVYVRDMEAFVDMAIENGWELDSEDRYPGDEFNSIRKGAVNLIVTENFEFFTQMVVATLLCRRLNLHNKEDRLAVFEAVQNRVYLEAPGETPLGFVPF
jgi:hypothetical protein